jgi:hypothetical protein
MSVRIGDVRLQFDEYILILRNVFYVPDLMINVISVEKLKIDNYVSYISWLHSLFDGETL